MAENGKWQRNGVQKMAQKKFLKKEKEEKEKKKNLPCTPLIRIRAEYKKKQDPPLYIYCVPHFLSKGEAFCDFGRKGRRKKRVLFG